MPFATEDEILRATDGVAGHLRGGGVIAYPTETVYGLGCALQPDALARLARLKQRSADKPFLLLVEDAAAIHGVQWTVAARSLAEHFWPGPLTLALRAEPGAFPDEVVSADGTVAVRATSHPAPRALVRALRAPITSTSANARGKPPARSAAEVEAAFGADGAELWLLDGGALPPSLPSTLVDCSGEVPRLVRAGAIGRAELGQVIGTIDDG